MKGNSRFPFDQNPAINLWQRWEMGERPDVKLFVELAEIESVDLLVEILQVDQTQRWGHGEKIRCEEYIDQFPILDQPETESQLLDLIYSEICLREDSRESPGIEEYLTRFPSLSNDLKHQFQIHCQFGRQALSESLSVSIRARLLSQASAPEGDTQLQRRQDFHSQFPQIPGYEVLELLNRGGMGIIFKARQKNLNRLVAIKMILAGAFSSESDHVRFSQEAEMIANLHHPNIVAVHEVGSLEFSQYFSMDFVDGVTLDSLFGPHGMEPDQAAHYLMVIARALDYAHQQGVVHRDLKPANIMIDQKGEPRILDFGLSIKVDSSRKISHSGMIVGTLTHMSPEQAKGDRAAVGPASDIYSLGSIFYEMLTGQLPFNEASPVALLRQITGQEPRAPKAIKPSIPRDLETICLKCLSKEPELRFHSAAELADEVERFLRNEPILSRPISITNRLYRWANRNPVVSSLIVLVVFLLSVGTTVSTYFAYESFAREKETARALDDLEQEQKRVIAAHKQAEQESLTARRNLYANQMTLALQAIEMGNINRAIDLLNRQWPAPGEEDLRGFDWYCLWQFLLSEKMAFKSSIPRVLSLAYSPSGDSLLGAGEDFSSVMWNSHTGELLKTFTTPEKHTNKAIGFTHDRKYLITGYFRLFVWDTTTGKLVRQFEERGGANAIAFSPDAPLFATAQGGLEEAEEIKEIRLWNYETGKLIRQIGETYTREKWIENIRFTPDGMQLVTCSRDKKIKFWNPADGQLLKVLEGHEDVVSDLAFFPDGNTLVSSSWDGTVKLWDLTSWNCTATLKGHRGIVRSVDVSPDGKLIASAAQDKEIVLWDNKTLKEQARLKGHPQMIWRVRFSPDGQTLASCSDAVRVKGDRSSTGAGSDVRLWDINTRREKKPQPSWKRRSFHSWTRDTWVTHFAYDQQRNVLISAHDNNRINFWNPDSGELLSTIDTKVPFKDIDISPGEDSLVVSSTDGSLRLYDLDSYQETKLEIAGQAMINGIDYHPLESVIAVAGDTSVCLCDYEGKILFQLLKTSEAFSLEFSPDGNFLAIVIGDHVQLWDWRNRKRQKKSAPQQYGFRAVHFSPNGKYLLSVGNNKNAFVWNAETLKPHITLRGHVSNVINGIFSPDGRRIATGAQDGTCRIWDTSTGAELLTLRGTDEMILALCFSPDGKSLFNGLRGWKGEKYGEIRTWRTSDDNSILKYLQKQFQDDPSQIDLQIALALTNYNLGQNMEMSAQERKQFIKTSKTISAELIKSGLLSEQQKERVPFNEALLFGN